MPGHRGHGVVRRAHRGPRAGGGRRRQFGLGRSRPRAVAIDRQELPAAGHPTQLDAAAVLEARTRADDQIAHGAGDEDVARRGLAEDARRDVYGEPPDVGLKQFALAGVDGRAVSIPNASASARRDSAQRIACVGPSNVTR